MKNLYVIDAYNLIYRMFYAIPEMHTREGIQINALFGVVKFIKSLTEMSPDDDIVVASESGSNFRAELFTEYKGTRDRMPDNLRSQIGLIFEFFEIAGVPVIIREGYEADDIIGSIVRNPDGYGEIIIISSDKDLCQFVRDGKVRIFDAMKQKNLREADVIEKFGVPALQVVDYLSIVGDTSDNIPGIAGFGPKKAVDLLSKYHTLQGIYDNMHELTPKMQEVLIAQRENAFLSQKLASIVTTLDIDYTNISHMSDVRIFEQSTVIEFLKKYDFKSLIPTEYREVRKVLERSDAIPVDTLDALDELQSQISRMKKIYLTTDTVGCIYIGLEQAVYKIDMTRVDAVAFFEVLFAREDITVVGYDLKEDIKKLIRYKNPHTGSEGQGRLF